MYESTMHDARTHIQTATFHTFKCIRYQCAHRDRMAAGHSLDFMWIVVAAPVERSPQFTIAYCPHSRAQANFIAKKTKKP